MGRGRTRIVPNVILSIAQFIKRYLKRSQTIEEALKDNFDTPTVMSELLSLASNIHSYIQKKDLYTSIELLHTTSSYIERMLNIFGVERKVEMPIESSMDPNVQLIDTLASFRSKVKSIAVSADPETKQKLLEECDELRDRTLPSLFIQLQDRQDGGFVWKVSDKETFEREERAKEEVGLD